MKINGMPRVGGVNPYTKHEPRSTERKPNKDKQKDEIRISPEAQELHDAQGTAESERKRKIEDLKHSVSTGTYHVEARKIAEKLFPYIK